MNHPAASSGVLIRERKGRQSGLAAALPALYPNAFAFNIFTYTS